MSSERTLPRDQVPTWRLASRRSQPHGSRRHPMRPVHASPSPFDAHASGVAHESAARSTRPAAPIPAAPIPAAPIPAQASAAASTFQVEVLYRVQATRNAVTLWLARRGSREAPAPYLPGQFTTLALSIGGATHYRSYSLCGDGSADWPWEITIKREGLVSSILCDEVLPGSLLQASRPRGAFILPSPLDPRVPLIFVAAGSGITPIYGMLRAIACLPPDQRPPVQLHYATRDQAEMIFAGELAHLDPDACWLRQWDYVSDHGDRLTPDRLLALVERDGIASSTAHWYICAPEELKHTLTHTLRRQGVPSARIHLEVFTSPHTPARAPSQQPHVAGASRTRLSPIRLRLAESGNLLDVQSGETLLETLERHGYQPSFGCRAGSCGECKLRVLSGNVTAPDNGILTPAECSAGYVQSCVAQPHGEVTLAGIESPVEAIAGAASGSHKIAAIQPGRRGFRAFMRVGVLAATIGLFAGAWLMTSPSPSLAPTSSTSSTPSASPSTDTNAPAIQPKSTPVSSGIGE